METKVICQHCADINNKFTVCKTCSIVEECEECQKGWCPVHDESSEEINAYIVLMWQQEDAQAALLAAIEDEKRDF